MSVKTKVQKKVAVGSKNPVKIEAVRLAFNDVWPDIEWEVIGTDVKSGVSDQPMSDRESIKGATNRAKRSRNLLDADFGVGLEGGLQKVGKEYVDSGWAIVVAKDGRIGVGSSVRMHTPHKMMQMVFEEGIELGKVCDILFKRQNSGQAEGQFGLMTKNLITRTEGYRQGIISALVRFIHPNLYN
jgi:inosine/xanthosine triphosphatase